MLSPYNNAFLTPFFLVPDFFVKKETVSGINGNTQGVINAIRPPRNPSRKIIQRLLLVWSSSPQLFTGFFISNPGTNILPSALSPPSSSTVKFKLVEG